MGIVECGALVPILMEPVVKIRQEPFMFISEGIFGLELDPLLLKRHTMTDNFLQDWPAMQVEGPRESNEYMGIIELARWSWSSQKATSYRCFLFCLLRLGFGANSIVGGAVKR
jgi:hypothetical protein